MLIVEISIPTSFLWRHKILDAIRAYIGIDHISGVVEGDETFFQLSYKGNVEPNIPSLSIVYGNQNILVERGGFKWTTKDGVFNEKSIVADSASPEQIAANMDGNTILPQSELKLEFSEKPNEVTIIDWSKSKDNAYIFKDNAIIVPKESGTYIYEIIGKWAKGQVSYTTKIIINS